MSKVREGKSTEANSVYTAGEGDCGRRWGGRGRRRGGLEKLLLNSEERKAGTPAPPAACPTVHRPPLLCPPPLSFFQDLPMGGVANVCRPTIWAGPRPSRKSLNWLSAPSRVGKINLQKEAEGT